MNYFQKNRKNIIIAVVATLLLAALIALWLQKKVIHSSDDIVGAVYPLSLTVGDTLHFEDKTPFAKQRKWNFADGDGSDKKKGYHFFTKPGYYSVTLIIDDKYTKTYPIVVSSRRVERKDSLTRATIIEAPTQAYQFENVNFRAISEGKLFTWKFGENTGTGIDSKDKLTTYSYKKPGDYVVELLTDVDKDPIYHKIRIIAEYNEVEETVAADDFYEQKDNDFKYRLQQIANGNSFNMNYNYLLSKYLCNNENTIVQVSDSKINNFYLYCAGLQFDKNNVIQTVKLNYDEASCVTKVEINQSK
nr:PKD domain-containing protein [uncultured Chryseobacterium sp.]